MPELMEISGLGEPGRISINVVDERGRPLPDIVVIGIDPVTKAYIGEGKTDANGKLAFPVMNDRMLELRAVVPTTKSAPFVVADSNAEATIVVYDYVSASAKAPVTGGDFPWLMVGSVLAVGAAAWYIFIRPRHTQIATALGIIEPCKRKYRRRSRPARDQKFCLMDSKGKKVLGRHKTFSQAVKQEQAIEISKRRRRG